MDRDDLIHRIEQYSARKGLVLRESLGAGIHGNVFAADYQTKGGRSAVKGHGRQDAYRRERDVYLRLRERDVTEIRGCHVPALIDFDDDLRCIEMTVVSRPFVLDFAGAWLDEPPTSPRKSSPIGRRRSKTNSARSSRFGGHGQLERGRKIPCPQCPGADGRFLKVGSDRAHQGHNTRINHCV